MRTYLFVMDNAQHIDLLNELLADDLVHKYTFEQNFCFIQVKECSEEIKAKIIDELMIMKKNK